MLTQETLVLSNQGPHKSFDKEKSAPQQIPKRSEVASSRLDDLQAKEFELNHHSYERGIEIRVATTIIGHPQLSRLSPQLSFYFTDGCLMIAGQVPSFYLKQVVQEVARKIDGVRTVENRIEVSNSSQC